MSKRNLRVVAVVLGAILLCAVIVLLIGPFLLPIAPLDDLASADQVAGDASQFVMIPYPGMDGLDIHYMEEMSDENGPTFVLLHGSLFNVYTWSEVIDFFGDHGRVIVYDQIPYGLSEKPVAGEWAEDNPYTSQAAVDQLLSFLDALNIDEAILVGNSYGGVLAAQAALVEPERVKALVLADAAVYVEEEVPAWLMNLPQVRRLGLLFARRLGQSEAFIRQTYRDPELISGERMALTMVNTRVENWDTALWEYLRVWGTDAIDLTDRIDQIQQPTLVISGDSDAIVPLADSQRLHSELPRAELAVLTACGHVPQEECPEQFEEAVAVWLSKLGW